MSRKQLRSGSHEKSAVQKNQRGRGTVTGTWPGAIGTRGPRSSDAIDIDSDPINADWLHGKPCPASAKPLAVMASRKRAVVARIKHAEPVIEPDDDDDDGVEDFPLSAALLKDAGVETDDDWDAIPAIMPAVNRKPAKRAAVKAARRSAVGPARRTGL